MVALAETPSIPIIDLEPARNGGPEAIAKVAHEVYQAFKYVGFAYIKNHGVPQELVDEAFGWVCLLSPEFPSPANSSGSH
jgi:isopenicillin N synthase-like dioxygenase